MNETAPVNKMT